MSAPFNFMKWIEDNRHLLKPPVGNKCMIDEDFIVMVVGGPNKRKDYHYEEGPEFFYQIEGDITVKIIEDGEKKDINLSAGDMYYLPPRIPHSPQRSEGSIGVVIERKRTDGEMDGLMWYCENCGNKLYEEFFQLDNIVEQLPPIMEKFYADEEKRTCSNCGTVMESPVKK
jgi:3-hydroxyanthranilate 3,4-dioxygenase